MVSTQGNMGVMTQGDIGVKMQIDMGIILFLLLQSVLDILFFICYLIRGKKKSNTHASFHIWMSHVMYLNESRHLCK